MRDITLGDTFRHPFTTRQFSDGIPTLLAGTPVLSVLEENNATPITAGVSVSVDRATVAGLNEATIIATSGNGYETGKSYAIYISTGTVGGVSVVGEVVGEFTIEKSAAFIRLGAPAGASISADIAVIEGQTDDIGVAGAGLTAIPINDANVTQWNGAAVAVPSVVGVPEVDVTHVVATVQTAGDIIGDTNDIQTRLPAALVNSRMDATLDATGMEAGAVDQIWDEAAVETTGAPSITGTFRQIMQWMFALSRNRMTQTATTSTLRNDADAADLAISTVSDDGTTFVRGEWSV